jgi:F-type H+-transporting ATPase subunit gamma
MDFSFTCFGKKGRDWVRKSKPADDEAHLGVVGATFGFNVASPQGRKLVNGYLDGDLRRSVHGLFAEFIEDGQAGSRESATAAHSAH